MSASIGFQAKQLKAEIQTSFQSLADSLGSVREAWEPKTTAKNLELIRVARKSRGIAQEWLDGAIRALRQARVKK